MQVEARNQPQVSLLKNPEFLRQALTEICGWLGSADWSVSSRDLPVSSFSSAGIIGGFSRG